MENNMKSLKLLVLWGIFLSNVACGTVHENWSVQSTEVQFEQTNEVIYKTFKNNQSSMLSATPNIQSEKMNKVSDKKPIQTKTIIVRPKAKGVNQEFWIFDAWVEFYSDDDGDGYFNYFSVEFDADTEYWSAQVYAKLYLGKDEIFREYHTTSGFNIFSDSSDDSFVVESELLNGFSSAEYEVLIELYDAYTHERVAIYDGNSDADLYLLSLESKEYESTQIVMINEHGGSMSFLSLLLLPLLCFTRQYKNA
jgi:hypothetical protein